MGRRCRPPGSSGGHSRAGGREPRAAALRSAAQRRRARRAARPRRRAAPAARRKRHDEVVPLLRIATQRVGEDLACPLRLGRSHGDQPATRRAGAPGRPSRTPRSTRCSPSRTSRGRRPARDRRIPLRPPGSSPPSSPELSPPVWPPPACTSAGCRTTRRCSGTGRRCRWPASPPAGCHPRAAPRDAACGGFRCAGWLARAPGPAGRCSCRGAAA